MKWRSGLTVGIEDLTRVVKRLIVPAFIPASLFLADWRIVLQISPGREKMVEMMWMLWGVDGFEGGPVECRVC